MLKNVGSSVASIVSEFRRSIIRRLQTGGLQNRMAGTRRYLLSSMIIDSDRPWGSRLVVVADRSRLPGEAEPGGFNLSDQFSKRHGLARSPRLSLVGTAPLWVTNPRRSIGD